uniref:Transmembrane protein n=1 Tax=Dechloromonas aromatica (strain RCB) TaxID=159087 RepID=Q47D64_DECAR
MNLYPHVAWFEWILALLLPAGLIMTQSVLLVFAISVSLSLNLVAGVLLFRSKRNDSAQTAALEGQKSVSVPKSSLLLDSEALMVEETPSPLVEAEIYFVYGRRDDAEAVLASALRQGQISPDEVIRLRDKMAAKRRFEVPFVS